MRSPERRIAEYLQRIDDLSRRLSVCITHTLRVQRLRVSAAVSRLQALSPDTVLGRGYAIVSDAATGDIVTSAAQTTIGRDLAIRLHEGQLTARVREIVPCSPHTDGEQG